VPVPVISSGIMSGKYKEFVSRYTDSMSFSRKTGSITAVVPEGELIIDADNAGQIYNLLVNTGMGKPQGQIPLETPVELRFGDGAVIQFWDSVITEKTAQRDIGLFVRYQGEDGYEYQYDTDALTLDSILNKLGQTGKGMTGTG